MILLVMKRKQLFFLSDVKMKVGFELVLFNNMQWITFAAEEPECNHLYLQRGGLKRSLGFSNINFIKAMKD